VLLLPDLFFSLGEFGIAPLKPLFIFAASGFDERCGQGFGELDFGLAFWAGDGWFSHINARGRRSSPSIHHYPPEHFWKEMLFVPG